MSKKLFSVIAVFGILALSQAAVVYAQLPGTAVHAFIPFDFTVRGKTLPAGDYKIERVFEAPNTFVILNEGNRADKNEHQVFHTESVEVERAPDRPELVFDRYGSRYFLHEILFLSGEGSGSELVPSRQERNLQRELAGNTAKVQTVAIALER